MVACLTPDQQVGGSNPSVLTFLNFFFNLEDNYHIKYAINNCAELKRERKEMINNLINEIIIQKIKYYLNQLNIFIIVINNLIIK